MYWKEFVNTLYNNNIIDTEMVMNNYKIFLIGEYNG